MKNLILLSLLLGLLWSCNPKDSTTSKPTQAIQKTDHVWQGTIKGNIPVELHYQLIGDLAMGEITYTNTTSKTPIKLAGNVEGESDVRLYEFDKSGQITGIITGNLKGDSIQGEWFSPLNQNNYALLLTKADKEVKALDLSVNKDEIFGRYHYQFGKDGSSGELDITKIDKDNVAFELTAVTEAPSHNIANIERDTIKMQGNSFTYMIPNTEDCGVKFSFYKDILEVKYTNGYCDGAFGLNATVDGKFYKIK